MYKQNTRRKPLRELTEKVISMNKSSLNLFAVKTIVLSVFGLSTLPFLAMIVGYIDSVTGFIAGRGYYSDSTMYMFKSPLIYIGIILCVNIIFSVAVLLYNHFKKKR